MLLTYGLQGNGLCPSQAAHGVSLKFVLGHAFVSLPLYPDLPDSLINGLVQPVHVYVHVSERMRMSMCMCNCVVVCAFVCV